MKTVVASLALFVLPVAGADISGVWKLEANIAEVHVNRLCTLKQVGKKLTGGCKNQTDEKILTGEVEGKNISWSYEADYQGQKMTLVYKGTLEPGSEIKGSITTEGAIGNFTAKKQSSGACGCGEMEGNEAPEYPCHLVLARSTQRRAIGPQLSGAIAASASAVHHDGVR